MLTNYIVTFEQMSPGDLNKCGGWMANSLSANQMPLSVATDLCLHCLLRPSFLNVLGKYCNFVDSDRIT